MCAGNVGKPGGPKGKRIGYEGQRGKQKEGKESRKVTRRDAYNSWVQPLLYLWKMKV